MLNAAFNWPPLHLSSLLRRLTVWIDRARRWSIVCFRPMLSLYCRRFPQLDRNTILPQQLNHALRDGTCWRRSSSFIQCAHVVTGHPAHSFAIHNWWLTATLGPIAWRATAISLISSSYPIVLLPRPRFDVRFVAFYKVLGSRFFSCSPLFSSRHLTTSSTQYSLLLSLSLSTRNDLPAASQLSHLKYISMDSFALFDAIFTSISSTPANQTPDTTNTPSDSERAQASFTYCVIAWAGLMQWVSSAVFASERSIITPLCLAVYPRLHTTLYAYGLFAFETTYRF